MADTVCLDGKCLKCGADIHMVFDPNARKDIDSFSKCTICGNKASLTEKERIYHIVDSLVTPSCFFIFRIISLVEHSFAPA